MALSVLLLLSRVYTERLDHTFVARCYNVTDHYVICEVEPKLRNWGGRW